MDKTASKDFKSAEAGRKKHLVELEALYAISRILASRGGQRQVLAEVLDVLHDRLGMTRGTISLLKPGGDEVLIEVAHNLTDEDLIAVRYRKGEGVTGTVVATGSPVAVPRISQEPLFLDKLHRRKDLAREEISFVCVPISSGEEVIGALSADRVFDETVSLDQDVRVLSIVASMIANDVEVRRQQAAEREALQAENVRLRQELEDRFRPENIIGNSHAMREVYRSIYRVAQSETTVLIRGDTGTGKELVAHAIHYAGPRARGPFVKINCAALQESLLESELFGHVQGAYTGAIKDRVGRIEQADGGTLFLDEIGEFPPATQVKLLRVIQEKSYERVGSSQARRADVRIICATNRDLEEAVAAGEFRQDLYYRVNVFPIYLPPLKQRKDDILLLADHFVERYTQKLHKDVRRISTPAINMMMAYHWPGNVRELENCIERAVLLSTDGVIHGHNLPPTLQTSDFSDTVGFGTLAERVALFERDIVVDALKRTFGNVAAAARELGTTARILRYRTQKLGVNPDDYKKSRPGKRK